MISVSGIRGVFGKDLNPQNLALYSAALGTWAQGGTIVVGRDTRVTGELCERIVTGALQSVGCNVISLGIVPTPTVAMGVLRHQAAGGIVISASHNPAEWNALKLLNEKSEFLDNQQGSSVIEIADTGSITYAGYRQIGSVTEDEGITLHHMQKILDLPWLDTGKISNAGFKVAFDAVNGAGSGVIPPFLKMLGVGQVETIHCVPNGDFPHNPEPLPEHLTDVCRLVKDKKCDIGVVVDPDADRLAIVDENGKLWGEEYTLAAAMDFMLGKKKGPAAANLSSSRVLDDMAKKHGVTCHRSPVGEINVVKEMQRVNAVIGGEGNGGVICPDLHYGRDALVGIAMILQHLAESGKTAAEYRNSLPDYTITKTKMPLDGIDADSILKKIQLTYARHDPVTIDGVKINMPEGWIHLRKSNTEPIIRIYSEASTAEEARKLAEEVMENIRS
ncbi:MAG: phosphoglucosamine mutase [Balneolales bacterium]